MVMDIGENNYFFKKIADLQDRVAELEKKKMNELYKYETSKEFKTELEHLINKHNIDTELGIPDFIIADYINSSLYILETVQTANNLWKEKILPSVSNGSSQEAN